tara:strand:- start:37562 stop:38206 length:645 start_codon:yes stop_codon:yes gene_type:complete
MTLNQSRSERRRRVLETTLIESHQDIFRFLVRKLRNEADAKDVIQEFYVKALTRFDDLKDEDRLRGWLSQILRSTIADFFRARARTRKALGTYATEAALEFDDAELDAAICACLYKMLPTLNRDYADLIWRVDLLGEDRSAIADDLGLTDNGLRVKLHRARRAMRDRLEQTCLTCVEHGYFRCACPGAEGLRKHGPVKRPAGRAGPDRARPVEP